MDIKLLFDELNNIIAKLYYADIYPDFIELENISIKREKVNIEDFRSYLDTRFDMCYTDKIHIKQLCSKEDIKEMNYSFSIKNCVDIFDNVNKAKLDEVIDFMEANNILCLGFGDSNIGIKTDSDHYKTKIGDYYINTKDKDKARHVHYIYNNDDFLYDTVEICDYCVFIKFVTEEQVLSNIESTMVPIKELMIDRSKNFEWGCFEKSKCYHIHEWISNIIKILPNIVLVCNTNELYELLEIDGERNILHNCEIELVKEYWDDSGKCDCDDFHKANYKYNLNLHYSVEIVRKHCLYLIENCKEFYYDLINLGAYDKKLSKEDLTKIILTRDREILLNVEDILELLPPSRAKSARK